MVLLALAVFVTKWCARVHTRVPSLMRHLRAALGPVYIALMPLCLHCAPHFTSCHCPDKKNTKQKNENKVPLILIALAFTHVGLMLSAVVAIPV